MVHMSYNRGIQIARKSSSWPLRRWLKAGWSNNLLALGESSGPLLGRHKQELGDFGRRLRSPKRKTSPLYSGLQVRWKVSILPKVHKPEISKITQWMVLLGRSHVSKWNELLRIWFLWQQVSQPSAAQATGSHGNSEFDEIETLDLIGHRLHHARTFRKIFTSNYRQPMRVFTSLGCSCDWSI